MIRIQELLSQLYSTLYELENKKDMTRELRHYLISRLEILFDVLADQVDSEYHTRIKSIINSSCGYIYYVDTDSIITNN